jgi:P27 family predicted phage terminase small subunit
MRGRKPLPTDAKRLAGNPGGRPLNEDEPQHPTSADLLIPPPELHGDTKAIDYWNDIVPRLATARQVTDVDRAALIVLCLTWSQYVEASDFMQQRDEKGQRRSLIKTPNGLYQINPYVKLMRASLSELVRLWGELGLTPSSRSRVKSSDSLPPLDGDDFSEFDAEDHDAARH